MVSKATFLFIVVLNIADCSNGTALNGKCDSDDDCEAVDSYCNSGSCVCKTNFAYYDGTCIQVVDPRMSCMSNINCQATLGDGGICQDVSCACLPDYHLHNNKCIRSRGLYERCEEDYECYWGKDMAEKMSCISGECTCKLGYTPQQHRRCESNANNTNFVTPSIKMILIVTLIINLF